MKPRVFVSTHEGNQNLSSRKNYLKGKKSKSQKASEPIESEFSNLIVDRFLINNVCICLLLTV